MQRRDAIKSAGALVVLARYRWTKMLVRRQSNDSEIIVTVARASFISTRI
jgi:hypothetical protein